MSDGADGESASELSHAERAQAFFENPQRFEELKRPGESEKRYFEKLARKAAQQFDFEDWVGFLQAFFSRADESVEQKFESNLARHGKNMILGTGLRGSNFQVGTVSELQSQMDAYAQIGLQIPRLDRIVETMLEHAYDDSQDAHEPHYIVGLCDSLLQAVPEASLSSRSDDKETASELEIDDPSPRERAVEVLARARATAQIQISAQPEDHIDTIVEKYVEATYCPTVDGTPVDGLASATEYLDAADRVPYADDQRTHRCIAALHCPDVDPRVLFTVLFLTGRDILETYRHGGGPARGAMLLAERQLNAIRDMDAPPLEDPDKWPHYVGSAAEVMTAIERSGGAFESDREQRPDQVQYEAAFSYMEGAKLIAPVDPERATKYRSKAFRAAATKDNDPETNVLLHECALGWFLRELPRSEADVEETVQDTIAYHEFARDRAKLLRDYVARDYEAVLDNYSAAIDSLKAAPQAFVDTTDLKYRHDVAQARRYELEQEFDRAQEAYKVVDSGHKRIKNREALCRVKRAVVDEELDCALDLVETEFDEPKVVRAAIEALTGKETGQVSTKTPLNIDLAAAEPDRASALAWILTFASEEEVSGATFQGVVREHFLKL